MDVTARVNRRRVKVPVLVAVTVVALGGVSLRALPPGAGTRSSLATVRAYRTHISPLMARAGIRCRFELTCSRYAEQAIRKHGVLLGSVATARRILRCTPLTPLGTRDEP
jgi:putative membrane protein insertion efficiency factor